MSIIPNNETPSPIRTIRGNVKSGARNDAPLPVPGTSQSNKKGPGAFEQNARPNPLSLPPMSGMKTSKDATVKTQAIQKGIAEIKSYAEKRISAYMETLRGMVAFPGKGVSYYVKLQVSVAKTIDMMKVWASVHEICERCATIAPDNTAALRELAGAVSSALLPEISGATDIMNDQSPAYAGNERQVAAHAIKEYSAILHKITRNL